MQREVLALGDYFKGLFSLSWNTGRHHEGNARQSSTHVFVRESDEEMREKTELDKHFESRGRAARREKREKFRRTRDMVQ